MYFRDGHDVVLRLRTVTRLGLHFGKVVRHTVNLITTELCHKSTAIDHMEYECHITNLQAFPCEHACITCVKSSSQVSLREDYETFDHLDHERVQIVDPLPDNRVSIVKIDRLNGSMGKDGYLDHALE